MRDEIQRRAFLTKLERDTTFTACYPHPSFPTISVTGEGCALDCKHCGRRYLRHMISCPSPDALFETCLELSSGGARGVLLSGGFNSEGYVPFEPFIDAIGRVKRETGLFISAHTGIVPSWLARDLGRAGVELADFDLIGDDETVKLVLGMDKTTEDYRRTLHTLRRWIPYVVPHICVGLHSGVMKGERKALEIAAEINPKALVFLVFTPTQGTKFERAGVPSLEEVGSFIAEARLKFPNVMLALGCMRPRGSRKCEFEIAATLSGIDRIEIPGERTIDLARGLELQVSRMDACCSVPSDFVGVRGA